ncbi:MAG: NAD-dependent epimerase/dehydratase family protein [Desulfobacterales bacterium]|jgi:nucleoside-diphosphate-sugar epimerase
MASKSQSFHSYFKKKNILITGSSGYIASSIVNALSKVDCTIFRLSRDISKLVPIQQGARVIDMQADITSAEDWERWLKNIDIVYHLAAQTSSYKADEDPLSDLNINVLPTLKILTTCETIGFKPTIVFVGTATEIGLSNSLPVNEEHYEAPISIYDIHKLMAEKYLLYYANRGIVRGCVLRLSNVYGPGPKSSSADRGILNLMVKRAVAGKPLTIYGSGEHMRDYIYVDDVVNAFLLAAKCIDKTNTNHFVIGSGTGYSIAQAVNHVAEGVFEKTNRRVDVVHVDPPSHLSRIEERSFVADIRKFSACTGWKPFYSLDEGISRTIDFCKSQQKEG